MIIEIVIMDEDYLMSFLQHCEKELSTEKNGNPFPQHPSDPKDGRYLTLKYLKTLQAFCVQAGIEMSREAPLLARFIQFVEKDKEAQIQLGKPFTRQFMEKIIDDVIRPCSSGFHFSSRLETM
jgi:hypothetical protein